MQTGRLALGFCVALSAADCSWDAGSHSDFMTFGAGDSLATARVEQAQEMWPPASLNNRLKFESKRFIEFAAPKPGKLDSGQETGGSSSSSFSGGSQLSTGLK